MLLVPPSTYLKVSERSQMIAPLDYFVKLIKV